MNAVIDDRASVGHQFRDFAHATDVLHPVVRREPEIRVQSVPNVVAVEHVGVHATMEQLALKRLRDGRFPGAGKAGQPNDRSPMAGCALRVREP